MSTTAMKARSALTGDELYQRRARAALPILVRQAMGGEPLTYGRLADELDMPNARNGNYVLGAAGRAVADYSEEHGVRVPPLTAIIVNQDTRLPSDGVAEFLDHPEEYLRASAQVRRRIVKVIYAEMVECAGWDHMLLHMGLQAVDSLLTDPRPVRGGGGEGDVHRRLKDYIAAHPQSVGLSKRIKPGKVEALLSSGDEVDVLFNVGRNYIAIEVKVADAPDSEIVRGMYQCVKYEAVLRAMQKAIPSKPVAKAWLALGGVLPGRLVGLRNALGITVLQKVAPA